MKNFTLKCVICGETYAPQDVKYVCPKHGNEGILDVVYDYDAIQSSLKNQQLPLANPWRGMFEYRPFLPVLEETAAPTLLVGGTPFMDAPRLAAKLGVGSVWLKDDGRNPTASLKDRASAIAVMKAQENGAEIVTTASTGNAAAALAGLAANTAQKTVIFVPASAPPAKITQLLVYGATVLLVDGTYDEAFELCLKATHQFGWYCRNTGYNPYMAEGKKTVTFEIYDQWAETAVSTPPTHIFVSVGDGCIISGAHKGLRDLDSVGLLPHRPKLMGVQAEGSSFLYEVWKNGEDVLKKPPVAANTVADSISAGLPRDRIKALNAVTQTDGAFIQVTDDEILAAIPILAQGSGIFGEPAAAAALAGLIKAANEGQVGKDDHIVLILTGNGLKDVASAKKATGQAVTIPAELTAVEALFQ